MLDDLYLDANLKTAQDAAMRPPAVPKQAAGFSAWRTAKALPTGMVAGGSQSGAFLSDVLGAFGQALDATGTASAGGMFSTQTDAERKQSEQQAQQIRTAGLNFSSGAGDELRGFARFLAPDPETAHTSERLVFDLARVATKAVGYSVAGGGPVAGAVLTGADEGMTTADDLKQQGVDLAARTAVGAVVGAATGLGVALPVAGSTAGRTAALVATGGPLSFMAQQQAVRSILQSQDYSKLAEQYDPFDLVGLAVSTLIPAGFGAWGLRASKARAAAEAKAAEAQAARDFAAGPVPSDETAIAKAARQATDEHIDAARVLLDVEHRRSTNPLGDDMRAADAHEAALSRAVDQLARGERVTVDDMLPPVRPSPQALAALAELNTLQTERATLLPVAGALAERGAIRTAREELRLMEQQRPDTTDAGTKALAKAIQEREGVSYKAALANAKKQLQGQLADFEARQQRLQQTIDSNARAQQAVQRLGEIDQRVTALEQQVGAGGGALPQFAQRIATAGRAIEAELPKPTAPKEPTRAAEPAAPKSAAAEPAPAAPATPARAAAAPAAGPDGARPAAAGAKAGLVEDAAAAARVDQVKADTPDLMVQLDGMDAPMRVDELLAAAKAEADDMLADGELMQTAAACALSVGA